MRLFVAAEVADRGVLDMVAGLEAGGYRRVPPESLHFTLKFLGEVDRERLTNIRERLRTVEFRPFPLELDRAGVFPPSKRPRVVWVAPGTGAADLAALANQIDVALSGAGFAPNRRWMPHMTVFRAPRRAARAESVNPDIKPARMTVSEFVLKRSILGGRPTYVTLEKYHGG